MTTTLVYLNGSLAPASETGVSYRDHGMQYGYGLFETILVRNYRACWLREHLDRLIAAASVINLHLPTGEYLAAAIQQAIQANNLELGSLRLTVSAGPGANWDPATCLAPTIGIACNPHLPYQPESYQLGWHAVIVSFPRNHRSPLVRIKSLNYIENILAKKEALHRQADEGLFVNTVNQLTEGSMSNLFLIRNGTLLTPHIDSGLLPGIIRGVVLRLAPQLGIPVVECAVNLQELLYADESFLTSSLLGIMPLTRVESTPIGSSQPGPITHELIKQLEIVENLNVRNL